ncbi:GNAT family N-acetyltransferase [Streptomyces sp. NPDC092903]|uniref:GNAT family N-acetyltransferase n=1 Tax=Streptomyces sp. NPDC092903 TaxID=3366017 RepID=UPI0037F39C46
MTPNPHPQRAWWPATLRTDRLTLRPVTEQDADTAERLWRDERVRRYLGGPVAESEIEARRKRLPGTPGLFAVTESGTDAVLGLVIVDPHSSRHATEVSYALLPEHWGTGVARDGVRVAVDWALACVPGTDHVVAVTNAGNHSSRRLLESIGMHCTGEITEYGESQRVYRTGVRPSSDTDAPDT